MVSQASLFCSSMLPNIHSSCYDWIRFIFFFAAAFIHLCKWTQFIYSFSCKHAFKLFVVYRVLPLSWRYCFYVLQGIYTNCSLNMYFLFMWATNRLGFCRIPWLHHMTEFKSIEWGNSLKGLKLAFQIVCVSFPCYLFLLSNWSLKLRGSR